MHEYFPLSAVPESDVATMRNAVSNILQCLLANTGPTNRAIFFNVLEAVDLGHKFLCSADKELCEQLVEGAYGSKEPQTATPERKEEGDKEEAAPEGRMPDESVPEDTPTEGNKQEVAEEVTPEETVPKMKEKDVEEAGHEEASPKPQEVAGARKLFAKLSSSRAKDVSTTPQSTQDSALILDAEFWGESVTAATAVSMCIDMAGFDAVHVRKVEELATSLLPPPGSGEKGASLMHRK